MLKRNAREDPYILDTARATGERKWGDPGLKEEDRARTGEKGMKRGNGQEDF